MQSEWIEHDLVVGRLRHTQEKLKQTKKSLNKSTIEVTNLQVALAETKIQLNEEIEKQSNNSRRRVPFDVNKIASSLQDMDPVEKEIEKQEEILSKYKQKKQRHWSDIGKSLTFLSIS